MSGPAGLILLGIAAALDDQPAAGPSVVAVVIETSADGRGFAAFGRATKGWT